MTIPNSSDAAAIPVAVPALSPVEGPALSSVEDPAGVLRVQQVSKQYPTPAEPLAVLRNVSFELHPGQTLAIVGPSGSGKSTLLNILGTIDQPTSGEVTLDGVNPFVLPPNELAHFRGTRIGFVFQDHHLLPQLSALENVLIPRLRGTRARCRHKKSGRPASAGRSGGAIQRTCPANYPAASDSALRSRGP